ncbi:hypothetical protein FC685_21030 [Bacillus cereus]|uniref:hypothetical protein n=1 Tax=Bacillus cereus TaxID=1396 RepID=UPI0010BF0498|nr:hypothetical protein [Bacillus cereus]TKH87020.1 hypothetical protein FC685_21030 [Bacillus cereus]
MYPYNPYDPYNQYAYQQPQYDLQTQYQSYIDQDPYDQNRQFQLPISFPGTGNRQLERRVNELEQRVRQLENTVERHTRRLNRLNQRLRTVENRLNIPFAALEDGF